MTQVNFNSFGRSIFNTFTFLLGAILTCSVVFVLEISAMFTLKIQPSQKYMMILFIYMSIKVIAGMFFGTLVFLRKIKRDKFNKSWNGGIESSRKRVLKMLDTNLILLSVFIGLGISSFFTGLISFVPYWLKYFHP